MKSGEYKVPGQRGLDGYLRCLLVPDLSDHDYIGVVAQNRTQGSRKCQADFALHLNLVDTLKLILHGVLRGDDFSLLAV